MSIFYPQYYIETQADTLTTKRIKIIIVIIMRIKEIK